MSERAVYWRGMIERQAHSGLCVAEFCQREGLASPSFYVWRKRLRERPPDVGRPSAPEARACAPESGKRSADHSAAVFVPLTLAAEPQRPAPGAAIEIERTDGIVVRVFEGARRQTIADVLAALGAAS